MELIRAHKHPSNNIQETIDKDDDPRSIQLSEFVLGGNLAKCTVFLYGWL